MLNNPKVRIKKKHAAHGGAWKVAYADFATAMMALFMVLWICSQEDEILLSTSKYFQNPFNSPLDRSYGVLEEGSPSFEGTDGQANSIVDMAFLHSLAGEFFRILSLDQMQENEPIEINVTSDGLRITLYDKGNQALFKPRTSEMTEWGDFILQNLAWVIDRYDFKVRIDSHTPKISKNEKTSADYDPWTLTSTRADIARKKLIHYALDPKKIERITGFADAHPIPKTSPEDPINQRIEFSLVVE